MPALPPAPSVIRIALDFSLTATLKGGSRFFMLYSGGPPSVANLNTLCTDVETAWSSNLNSLMTNEFELTQITARDLTSDTAAAGEWTGSLAGGNSSHAAITVDAATLLNLQISRSYRGGKPKMFLPIGTIGDISGDPPTTWGNTFISDVDSGWAAFITALKALSGIGCTLTNQVNVSYYAGFASVQNPVTKRWRNIPTPRTGDATIDLITNFSCNPLISQQRRRRTATTY